MVFVTFLHGVSLPILFPITLFGLINSFVADKIMFAKYYQQPPLYDTAMNDRAINLLFYAPIFMMFNSYWLLGNQQMFFNQNKPIEYSSQILEANHSLFGFITNKEYYLLLPLIFIPLLLLVKFKTTQYHKLFEKIEKCCKFKKNENKYFDWKFEYKSYIDEKLGTYWECIEGLEQKRWFANELHIRNYCGIETLNDRNLKLLGKK